jgi:hypothetical protein
VRANLNLYSYSKISLFFAERAALVETAICEAKEYASRVQAESNKPVKR